MSKEESLILRRNIKKKKPNFLRQEAQRRKKLAKNWRQPKGGQSKLRKKQGGKRAHPSPGYSSPRKVRGLSREGLIIAAVGNLSEAESLDPKTQGAVISKVGKKKKVEIIKKLLEKKARILNIISPEEFVKETEEEIKKKKQEKKAKQEKKKKSKEERLKKAEEKKKKEEEEKKPEEEKKKEEKEEQRKILEKKE